MDVDPRVWREHGDPLVPGASPAVEEAGHPGVGTPLAGETVAVKDLYDVEGFRVGAGNPARLDAASPAPAHATLVATLLAAGASVRGIARTDEFAYSLAGTNHHYGAPPNPAA